VSGTSSIVVSIAQVAAGGTIVQGVMAFIRRRSELRQLDSQSDNVMIGTAEHLVIMLRTELTTTKTDMEKERADYRAERDDTLRQIMQLGDRVSKLQAENVVMRAEIARLQGNLP
jgi:hypothetical protein